MTNLYKVLGVKDFASQEEIKTAYRKLSKKFHPDVNDGDEFFENHFRAIQNAYEILSDSKQKEIHDTKLKNANINPETFGFKQNPNTETKEETTRESTNKNKQPINRKKEDDNFLLVVGSIVGISVITLIFYAKLTEKPPQINNTQKTYTHDRFSVDTSRITQEPIIQDSFTPPNDHHDAQNNSDYFTVGSTKEEVLKVQRYPGAIEKNEELELETWSYGISIVVFKKGRVYEYSNLSENLKVKMIPSKHSSAQSNYFTVGSTKDEVLEVQGVPSGIDKNEELELETWSYGTSKVIFKRGRVDEYSNLDRNLKVGL